MPKRYRDDSLYVYPGSSEFGWIVEQVPFPEEIGNDIEIRIIEEVYRNKQAAEKKARQCRSEFGGCWHVKPLEP